MDSRTDDLPAAARPAAAEPPSQPRLGGGVRRAVYLLLGTGFVSLGLLGALLPVLPTTPFLLLASYCFLRSSPRLNDRLLRSRLFGPFLRDWHEHRGVRPRVKVTAVAMLALAVGGSALFGNLPPLLLALLGVLALIGLVVILRLPVIRGEDDKVTR